jgi:Gliding motility associated protein GldN
MKIYINNITVFLLFFNSLNTYGQIRTVILDRENVECIYNLDNGRISGNYISYYNNGIKKSEGVLENGYRSGKWIVWDSAGRKRMERIYKNPFEFKRVFPPIPNEGPIPLLAENTYQLEYNADGIVEYAKLKAEDAVWRHKFWRYLKPVNNDILFRENRILKIIFELIKSNKTTVYDIVDDRFTTPIKNDSIVSLITADNVELVGLKLKEEGIFDMGRLVFEYRILGFCPVVKINGQQQELFWIYYPDLRKYLSKEIVIQKTGLPNINTLDDLFIFRHFSSSIIKSTIDNPYNRYIKDFPRITDKIILEIQEALELIIIEDENNIWISLTK